MARLFFAAWPDELARRRLGALAREAAVRVAGRAVPEEKLHLTLAFLGEVGADRMEALLAAAAQARGRDHEVVLDRLGSFARAKVAWIGPSEPVAGLVALQQSLAGTLSEAGFAVEEREFAPHMTLARKATEVLAPEAVQPVCWTCRGFALVRTDVGTGRYTTLASWPLD